MDDTPMTDNGDLVEPTEETAEATRPDPHQQVFGSDQQRAEAAHNLRAFLNKNRRMFAIPAAVTVHNAQILAQTERLTTQLQTALTSRLIIDQAIGILHARSGITAEEAFQQLRQLSQSEHLTLAAVAEKIVDKAVQRP